MTYREEDDKNSLALFRGVLKELPVFTREFFLSKNELAAKTKLGYARDLKLFFNFLYEEVNEFEGKNSKTFTLEDLKKVEASHIREFLAYLDFYINEDGTKELTNHRKAKARKLAAIRGMFKYFFMEEKIDSNPAERVESISQKKKDSIIRLEPDEVAKLLDLVETGNGLTKKQQEYHSHNVKRDLAIMTVFLGCGLRVSECVGIDITDVDFNVNGIRVNRKGNKTMVVYFGEEVEKALKDYMAERQEIEALPGHENALFLSMQKKRIGVRAVQQLVKKYKEQVVPLKKISPHKLRSTYGTTLYQETNDIYLVAAVLGHNDVNTTKRYYADMSEEYRRRAAGAVKLREDDEE